MTDTSYNGWTNRETWAANLWITNDQGLYESAREVVANSIEEAVNVHKDGLDDRAAYVAGEALKDWWEDLTDPEEELMTAFDILKMVRDVGDEDRIDWAEIASTLASE